MSKKTFQKLAQKYSDPIRVQSFLRALDYNHEPNGETLRSALSAYKESKAHCLEAALLAAAILEHQGYPPLVMSLESHDNLDHVIFVYKKDNRWGSIGRSRDEGLHGRKPMFRSLRDLALSYYEPYIDKTGCITGYQIAHLDEAKTDWRFSSKNVWKVEKYLIDIKHVAIKFNKKRYRRIHKKYLSGISAKKTNAWL
ncbi:MAG: hypothetical protein K0R29_421 [Pseudobdellovibrio sp.]|jgi:hypothetical protein|nr:hypothetical protein [Pseudobdellovibrio sp.]